MVLGMRKSQFLKSFKIQEVLIKSQFFEINYDCKKFEIKNSKISISAVSSKFEDSVKIIDLTGYFEIQKPSNFHSIPKIAKKIPKKARGERFY